MAMNPNWFYVKILMDGVYPKSVTDLAKKLDISPEEIARNKQIDASMIIDFAMRRDLVMNISSLMQTPDSPDEVLIEFMDKSTLICLDTVENLTKQIDKFLRLEPTIRMNPLPQIAYIPIQIEEGEEE